MTSIPMPLSTAASPAPRAPERSTGSWPTPLKKAAVIRPLTPGVVKYSAFAMKVTLRSRTAGRKNEAPRTRDDCWPGWRGPRPGCSRGLPPGSEGKLQRPSDGKLHGAVDQPNASCVVGQTLSRSMPQASTTLVGVSALRNGEGVASIGPVRSTGSSAPSGASRPPSGLERSASFSFTVHRFPAVAAPLGGVSRPARSDRRAAPAARARTGAGEGHAAHGLAGLVRGGGPRAGAACRRCAQVFVFGLSMGAALALRLAASMVRGERHRRRQSGEEGARGGGPRLPVLRHLVGR